MKLTRNKHRFAAEVGASSMSDIMFFLMLFFLIVSTLVNPSVMKLMLPKAKSTQTLSKQNFILEISKDKQYALNNAMVPFEELETKLRVLVAGKDEATVVIRVDKTLAIQDLVDVLEMGNRLKVKMVLATESQKK